MNQTINNTTNENKITKVAAYFCYYADPTNPSKQYDEQYEYYKEKITSNPDYEFTGIYADETSTNTRENFDAMVKDALDGKIDLIIMKSVSRLGKCTVENLNTIRILRDKGVDIYFENQNFSTLGPNSELILSIYGSFAAEEREKAEEEEFRRTHSTN